MSKSFSNFCLKILEKTNISSNDVSVTPSGKKLIQARLPFKTLASTPKVGIDSLGTAESRKRKLSATEDDARSIKLSKTSGSKENIEKTDEVTVLEMVDLVEDDIVMTNEKLPTIDLTRQSKKSTKGMDVDEKGVQLRRSSRKHDPNVPSKVVIKIQSTKKKKMNQRHGKANAVRKLDENAATVDDDDDVIPIDSEENSLNSVDGKEKEPSDKANSGIIVISVNKVLDSKVDVDKVTESTTSLEANDVPKIETVEPSDIPSDKDENSLTPVIKEHVVPEENTSSELNQSENTVVTMETDVRNASPVEIYSDKLDAVAIDEEGKESSDNKKIEEADVQEENLLSEDDETKASSSEEEVDNKVEAKTDSHLTTPAVVRRTRKLTENSAMTSPKTPVPKISDNKALTPKQLQKKLESEQKRLAKEKAKEDRERKIQEAKEERERKIQEAKEERERKIQEAKEERERKLQEEKEQRQKERDEKERQKKKERDDKEELKRKEREDKEEQRRKEKEEREKKKQAEIDAKNEEKRQKEEEKVAKEEAELKKKRKEAEAFTKFFAKKSNKSAESSDKMDVDEIEVIQNFMPFRVKPDMRLAPIVRRKLSPTRKSKFDDEVLNSIQIHSPTDLYIQSLRNGSHVSEKQGKTWPNEDNNDELMIIGLFFSVIFNLNVSHFQFRVFFSDDLEGGTPIEETSAIQKYRAKFFKFDENRRPPYYGTWQKKSSVITPRRPFVTDQVRFA